MAVVPGPRPGRSTMTAGPTTSAAGIASRNFAPIPLGSWAMATQHDSAPASVRARAPSPAAGTTYTCPMHPEIVSDRPGLVPDLRHGAGADDRLGG